MDELGWNLFVISETRTRRLGSFRRLFSTQASRRFKDGSYFYIGRIGKSPRITGNFKGIVNNTDNASELRAAAICALGNVCSLHPFILNFADDADNTVSNHAIALLEKVMTPAITDDILRAMSQSNRKAAIRCKTTIC